MTDISRGSIPCAASQRQRTNSATYQTCPPIRPPESGIKGPSIFKQPAISTSGSIENAGSGPGGHSHRTDHFDRWGTKRGTKDDRSLRSLERGTSGLESPSHMGIIP